MCEFLLNARPHPWESLTDTERDKLAEKDQYFTQKYNMRCLPGDIIQVEINDKWGKFVCANGAFYHIKVPPLKKEEYKYLERPHRVPYETSQEKDVEWMRHFAQLQRNSIVSGAPINEDEQEVYYQKMESKGKLVAKKRYRVDISQFPQLQTNPVLTLTKTQFLNVLVDKNGS